MSNLKDHVNTMYDHAIHLIYKNKCICNGVLEVKCDNSLNLVRILSDDHFKYDLNNGVLMCDLHKKWFEDNPEEATNFLFQNYPELANFEVTNRGASFEEESNLEDHRKILADSLVESVKNGPGRFPSLYGKFEV